MDHIMLLSWEIKIINGAFVCTCVFLHKCAQRIQGEVSKWSSITFPSPTVEGNYHRSTYTFK